MPIGSYFKGSGDKVMQTMQARYGASKGKNVFYATANKKKMKPADKVAKLKAVKSAAPRRPGAALKVMGGPAPLPKAPVAGGVGGGMMRKGGFR